MSFNKQTATNSDSGCKMLQTQ